MSIDTAPAGATPGAGSAAISARNVRRMEAAARMRSANKSAEQISRVEKGIDSISTILMIIGSSWVGLGFIWQIMHSLPRFVLRISHHDASTPMPVFAAALLGVSWLAASVAGFASFGPMASSPSSMSIVMSSPVSRRAMLTPRLWWTAFVAGCVTAVFVDSVFAQPFGQRALFVSGFAALIVVLGIGIATVLQGLSRPALVRSVTAVLTVVAVSSVVAAAILCHVDVAVAFVVPIVPVLIVAAVVAVASLTVGAWRLGSINRDSLATASGMSTSVAASMSMLDLRMFFGAFEDRWWKRLGTVRSRRLAGTVNIALLKVDALRVLRRPSWIVGWVVSLAVIAIFGALTIGSFAAFMAAILGFWALVPLARGLRTFRECRDFTAMMGIAKGEGAMIHLVVPAVGTAVWTLIAFFLIPQMTVAAALILGLGLFLSIWRSASRGAVKYDAKMIDTPSGPMPMGMAQSAFNVGIIVLVVAIGVLFAMIGR